MLCALASPPGAAGKPPSGAWVEATKSAARRVAAAATLAGQRPGRQPRGVDVGGDARPEAESAFGTLDAGQPGGRPRRPDRRQGFEGEDRERGEVGVACERPVGALVLEPVPEERRGGRCGRGAAPDRQREARPGIAGAFAVPTQVAARRGAPVAPGRLLARHREARGCRPGPHPHPSRRRRRSRCRPPPSALRRTAAHRRSGLRRRRRATPGIRRARSRRRRSATSTRRESAKRRRRCVR